MQITIDSSISTKILVCHCVPKKSAVLACLTMAKLKLNWHVPNKNVVLLKKIILMGAEIDSALFRHIRPAVFSEFSREIGLSDLSRDILLVVIVPC